MNKWLKYASIAAIINASLIIPSLVISYISQNIELANRATLNTINIVIMIAALIFSILIFNGYYIIGTHKKKEKFIQITVGIMIFFAVVMTFFDIFATFWFEYLANNLLLAVIVSFGITHVLFGISLLRIKKYHIGLITAIAVLYIVQGFFYMTVFLYALLVFTIIPIYILEAILFHKLKKKF